MSGITYLQNAKDGKNRQNVPSFMINSDLQTIFTGLLNDGLGVHFKRHFDNDHEYSNWTTLDFFSRENRCCSWSHGKD